VFAGRESSAGGSLYFRARDYDSGAGRFETEDPVVPFRYEYVDNMPLTTTDPTGRLSALENVVIFALTAESVFVLDCVTAPFKGGKWTPSLDPCDLVYPPIQYAGDVFSSLARQFRVINGQP